MITSAGVRALLPHRYPMLLVDRVLTAGAEDIRSLKAVTLNEPWYARLGPQPAEADFAYPEVLLVESWTQTAGLLAQRLAGGGNDDRTMLFGSMRDVSFHRRVFPGDVVEHHARLQRAVNDTVIFEGSSRVGDEPVLTIGAITVAFRPRERLDPEHSGPADPLTGSQRGEKS
ncbi:MULTISPECIES: 3-hydroxyacyl-ACP dehydratase FabZ family protein [unclassified Streptomyces]|uniref:3-hydroxyacyl-ACP dehydratase FabZ family protein n=1 Tax=unclassified Streptomyces TaxID=2593676 RepID=UPI00093F6A5C|nr:beta-hydroxyacyl-ACP dehydratase [Streptomyces sp. TSRI0281]OKI46582.1 beta-hydroxyacyl-ACP dehydratase [Streptomyces sp. TSRI0281]